MKTRIFMFGFAAICAPAPPAFAAGFDCTLPTLTPTEKAICENDTLSALDDAAGPFYLNQKKQVKFYDADSQVKALEEMKTYQKEWLAKRDGCDSDTRCIEDAYFEILESNDPAFIAGRAERMADLPENQVMLDYDRIVANEGSEGQLTYEVVLRSENVNAIERFLQGNFSQNNNAWLDFYANDERIESHESGEGGFPVTNLEFYLVPPYSEVKLMAESGDMILRGNMTYTFWVDFDDNLKLQMVDVQGISRPAIGDMYHNMWNYQTMTFSRAVGVSSADCELTEFPQLFIADPEDMFPIWPNSELDRPDYSNDRLEAGSPDPLTALDLRYQAAVKEATETPENSLAEFKSLEADDYPLPLGTIKCAEQFVEHFKQ